VHAQPELDRATAEAMLLALLGHVRKVLGNEAGRDVRALIHPYAEMRLLVSFGRPLRGRSAIVEALESGQAAVVFRVSDLHFDWLDPTTVLGLGRARHSLEDGEIVERDVCWLCEFRDRLIWRVQAFETADEACRAHAES
jgi:hypothetical protein